MGSKIRSMRREAERKKLGFNIKTAQSKVIKQLLKKVREEMEKEDDGTSE